MTSSSEMICLVDDEPSVLKALGRLLASEGFGAEQFCNPWLFLKHASKHPVRLVVVDIGMPDLSGLEVLERLRVISPDTRAIVMTGEHGTPHLADALAAGAVSFFLKPFDDEAFLQAVRAVMPQSAEDEIGDSD